LLEDPTREAAAYREVVAPLGIGPRCLATGDDWVLLERLEAPALWQIGELTVWVEVAKWVAGLHRLLAAVDIAEVPLVDHDAAFYRAWRERAERAGAPVLVLEAHDRATERLLALPATVIHGDLYPSNLLVDPGPPLRVWPVDWELIGHGPAVLDLAALSSGLWTAEQRAAMVDAYTSSAERSVASQCAASLDAARLHLCVQWLGTDPSWQPPPEHDHDWMSEALELAAAL
jgi:Ser/Thr protein kinase RdoA (MazF antagonist)